MVIAFADMVRAIQASLLREVQELSETEWLYPDSFEASASGQSSSSSYITPATAFDSVTAGTTWSDIAFNPLSATHYAAAGLNATSAFPGAERIEAALHAAETSRNGTHGPNLSFLDAQRQEYLADGETSFAAQASFPWATRLDPNMAAAANASPRRSTSMQGSALAREVEVIAL